ncbi:hypothetical protein BDA96_10G106300 [Sorghum bicolor]|uniref:SHSP domain-containing protein n=1 Tax=Sorghum bicolor TaxID=4558 RepID=A0A921Q0V3_SORBI|nr:hypothetical protein BDA96_10G106300 [Sorghum bicolor]
MASASAVASKWVPLAALLKELLASQSGSGKTGASASARRLSISKLFSADSSEDSTSDSDEDSSDEDAVTATATATRLRERYLSLAKLLIEDMLDEVSKMRVRLLLAPTDDDVGAASRTSGVSPRGWWVSKEDGDAVQLKVAVPGLGKEHVKMRAENDVLVIKGEVEGGDGDKGSARYSYRIVLSSHAFKMDQIKAEMNNGMLSLTVPKIKDEERKDVFEIKIE